ncbi:hypothetical protein MKZ38_005595 [Zalerion maritima]|uniref:Uncharacterized protein n=1 Tax=Zalerion maritima TaxID=339359 RepID=A0AAD5RK88_9PEZI|nr:hypothetical protein MKZ38_005595 [Zalerion maritima]
MVFPSAEQPRDTYRLGPPAFWLPTEDGDVLAVAVSKDVSNYLVSTYTILLELAFGYLWVVITALAVWVAMYLGKKNLLGVRLWNHRQSPLLQVLDVISEIKGAMKAIEWRILLTLLILLVGFAIQMAIAILFAGFIEISNAAPVNPNAVFLIEYDDTSSLAASAFAVEAPAVLRAAGIAEVSDYEVREKVHNKTIRNLPSEPEGGSNLQFNYAYNLTGVDFGLQRLSALELRIEGSCKTDYTWLVDSEKDSDTGLTKDTYNRFGNSSSPLSVSREADGKDPRVYVFTDRYSASGTTSNFTWGAIVSSVDVKSFSQGLDPWYLTESVDVEDPNVDASQKVKAGRPALSCWQSSVWWYENESRDPTKLDSMPKLSLSDAMLDRLWSLSNLPAVVDVGRKLGESALKSAQTSIGEFFEAKASSIEGDLQRLLLTTYIATANYFIDMTLVPEVQRSDFPNLLANEDGTGLADGADGFVVLGKDISTLSVTGLATIPAMLLVTMLLSFVLLRVRPLSSVKDDCDATAYQELHKYHMAPEAGQPVGEGDAEAQAGTYGSTTLTDEKGKQEGGREGDQKNTKGGKGETSVTVEEESKTSGEDQTNGGKVEKENKATGTGIGEDKSSLEAKAH